MEHQEVAATSPLKTLHQEGLLRVGGRLQRSTLPYQAMHQMILPLYHHFTKLVDSAEHGKLLHAGPQLLIAPLRKKFCIPRIRNLVKTSYSSVPDLLQIQSTSNTAADGWATTISNPTLEAIPHNRCRLHWTHIAKIGHTRQQNYNKGLYCNFCLLCDKGCPHWGCHKSNYISISCCPETFHSTSRETKNNPLRQCYQLPRCIKPTSRNLQNASILITDGKGTGLLGHRRMWLEIHPTTWTSLRRIMGSSGEIYEIPPEKNTGLSHRHLRGTLHITCWDRGLSKFQTFVCLIQWSI